MDAYVSALRRAIKPGSVVVDLGSGPGLFALLACQMGARRVYAIEPDDVIQVAREAAMVNGCLDRVEFIQDFSTNAKLPEQADVIVSDLRGILPLFQHHLPSIRDARCRLLAPDGILIPKRDTLWAAIAEVPNKYAEVVGPWEHNHQGVSLAAARNLVTNTWSKARVNSDDLLVQPVCWHTIDYYKAEDADVRGEISFSVTRAGIAHGLAVWFDSELHDGIGFSNSPGSQELIYGNAFFPFPQPVEVAIDDQVSIRLRADLIKDDYVWRWDTRIHEQEKPESLKADFKQSTLFGTPLSLMHLRKRATTYVPIPNDEGRLNSFILSRMDGKNSVEQIAADVANQFPLRFREASDALHVVAEISAKYSA
jgi:protein arginine N-methyltransferase 1